MRRNPSSHCSPPAALASATTRSIILPTVSQSIRSSRATTVFGASLASHTQVSSKARVKRLPALANGNSSLTMPQSGQAGRRTSRRSRQGVRSTSR
jgi:hypothetical protein